MDPRLWFAMVDMDERRWPPSANQRSLLASVSRSRRADSSIPGDVGAVGQDGAMLNARVSVPVDTAALRKARGAAFCLDAIIGTSELLPGAEGGAV